MFQHKCPGNKLKYVSTRYKEPTSELKTSVPEKGPNLTTSNIVGKMSTNPLLTKSL